MGTSELLILALLNAPAQDARVQTHTSLADVRDCVSIGGSQDWIIASEGGVARVDEDGHVLSSLNASTGLAGTRSATIMADTEVVNRFWVGGEAGVTLVDTGEGGLSIQQIWTSPAPVRALVQLEGQVLAGLWGVGLSRLDHSRSSVELLPSALDSDPAARRITSLYDDLGTLWVGTAGRGLWRSASGTEGLKLEAELGAERGDFVWSLTGYGGRLFLGRLDGVFDRHDRRFASVDARDLDVSSGRFLVGTMGEGIWGLEGEAEEAPSAYVQTVGQSGDRLCVGTPKGLWLKDASGDWAQHLHLGLPDQDVSALARDPATQELWAGTFDRGLAHFDGLRWSRLALGPDTNEIDPQINALTFDPVVPGRLWVGTARGLDRIDIASGQRRHWGKKDGLPGLKVLSLAPSHDGSMLVGTGRGPMRVRDGVLIPLGERVRQWAVWSIAEAPSGDGEPTIWLGTTQGLIAWHPRSVWRHLSVLSGHLPDNWVTALSWEGGRLWVGTYASGVVRLERGRSGWRGHPLGGGRINPGGLSRISGDGLYASTMQGLLHLDESKLTKDTGDAPKGASWTKLTNLPGEDVTAVLPASPNAIWVSTRRGVARLAR